MMRRIGTAVSISLTLSIFLLPVFGDIASAGVTGKYANLVEDTDLPRTYVFSQVIHKFRTWYYYNAAQNYEDRNYRISLLYIEKRHTGWDSWGKPALPYAYLRQFSNNVNIAYKSNDKVGDVGMFEEIPLYHYSPLDGSNDGSNGVGTMVPTAYIEIKYDLPDTFSNHVYRKYGTRIINYVYSYKSVIRYYEAQSWMYVPVANVAHFDPGYGFEINGYTYSDSWEVVWD